MLHRSEEGSKETKDPVQDNLNPANKIEPRTGCSGYSAIRGSTRWWLLELVVSVGALDGGSELTSVAPFVGELDGDSLTGTRRHQSEHEFFQ